MFRKLLIANRGEIARRVGQVAKQLGIATVAVFSDADEKLPFVREADEAVRIGPGPARDSYLNAEAILAAAQKTGADAVHPGYGFLSESPDFSQACERAQVVFVGPPARAMLRMKNKSEARRIAAEAGVPVVPGSSGLVSDVKMALEEAEKLGYPVLCKAAGGGGGIGMAEAANPAELEKGFRQCTERAKSAFGREQLYLERLFLSPRHIEVQVLGDSNGQVIHCFERECSIQRRHQKVLEEAPSPLFTTKESSSSRESLFQHALAAARAFGYVNAGTVEFLYAEGKFYFIEMNARLQVEHPVTEFTTGLNLIHSQLKIASGEPLGFAQKDVRQQGAAMEFRIYAEDPIKFLPSPGTLKVWAPPSGEGIRVDAGYEQGSVVTPFYDPMLAKLIVHGTTRQEVIARAQGALSSFVVEGVKTNISLHLRILNDIAFVKGELDTGFLNHHARP